MYCCKSCGGIGGIGNGTVGTGAFGASCGIGGAATVKFAGDIVCCGTCGTVVCTGVVVWAICAAGACTAPAIGFAICVVA